MNLTNITDQFSSIRSTSDISISPIGARANSFEDETVSSTRLYRLFPVFGIPYLDARSETAKKLHSYIMETLKFKEHLNLYTVKMIISDNPNSLLELSINRCSHLQDIIHIGSKFKLDSDLIRENVRCLFQEIRHCFPEKIGEVLLNQSKDGFTLLQEAVKNGKETIISMVMSWYQDAGLLKSPEFKKTILLNRTEAGFTLLQHAVANGKETIISMVMSWYQDAGLLESPEFKETILLNRTEAGFTLLQHAVRNGKETIISMVMSWYQDAGLLESPEFKEIILLNRTKQKYNLLHQIGLSRIPIGIVKEIINKIPDKDLIRLLNEKVYNTYSPGTFKNNEIYNLFNSERGRLQAHLSHHIPEKNIKKSLKKTYP